MMQKLNILMWVDSPVILDTSLKFTAHQIDNVRMFRSSETNINATFQCYERVNGKFRSELGEDLKMDRNLKI